MVNYIFDTMPDCQYCLLYGYTNKKSQTAPRLTQWCSVLCRSRHIRPVDEDKIYPPVCGGLDRQVLKASKGHTNGEEDRNYSCHHLPQELNIILYNTRRGTLRQLPTIRI